MERLLAGLQLLTLTALGVLLVIARKFVPAYGAKKGENLATKQDIGGITAEIEKVRLEYSAKLEQISQQNRLLLEEQKPLTAEETLRRENYVNAKLQAYYAAIDVLSRTLASMQWSGAAPADRKREPAPLEWEFNAAVAKLALFAGNAAILEAFYRTATGGTGAVESLQRFVELARVDMKYERAELTAGQFKYVFGRPQDAKQ